MISLFSRLINWTVSSKIIQLPFKPIHPAVLEKTGSLLFILQKKYSHEILKKLHNSFACNISQGGCDKKGSTRLRTK